MAEVDGQLADDYEARPQGLVSFFALFRRTSPKKLLSAVESPVLAYYSINNSSMLRKILKILKKVLAKDKAFL